MIRICFESIDQVEPGIHERARCAQSHRHSPSQCHWTCEHTWLQQPSDDEIEHIRQAVGHSLVAFLIPDLIRMVTAYLGKNYVRDCPGTVLIRTNPAPSPSLSNTRILLHKRFEWMRQESRAFPHYWDIVQISRHGLCEGLTCVNTVTKNNHEQSGTPCNTYWSIFEPPRYSADEQSLLNQFSAGQSVTLKWNKKRSCECTCMALDWTFHHAYLQTSTKNILGRNKEATVSCETVVFYLTMKEYIAYAIETN